jgi:hypothetical protein
MKKITFLVFLSILSCSIFAQTFKMVNDFPSVYHFNAMLSKDIKAIDTLVPPIWQTTQVCADTIVYYTMGASGYLTGNGNLGGQVICQISEAYENTGNKNVTTVLALMKRLTGTTGNMSAKIYSTGSGFTPTGAALGTSSSIATSTISNTQFQFVAFNFSPAVAVSGNFAAAVVLPTTAGDTVVLAGTRFGCVDATKDDRACVYGGTVWTSYKTILATIPYASIDIFICGIVNTGVGIDDNNAGNIGIFPNPASDDLFITSTLKMNSLNIFNSIGQQVFGQNDMNTMSQINTSAFENGVYFVQINTDNGISTRKVVIRK